MSNPNLQDEIKLTAFSHGAGCGCKISPAMLDQILKTGIRETFPGLLVGYDHKDDAAVLDIGNGQALISTTDFFMPIVDDAYDFGRIASVNAISDVYAMGGKPVLAIGILGWPIDKIPVEYASRVLEGARSVCAEAGIPLAGGHSIDSPEPIFGLAVSGLILTNHLKTNAGARCDDLIYLTKGLGAGVITTAEKRGIVAAEHLEKAKASMLKLNKIGQYLGTLSSVHAITDVTGFGLAGHLLEMCSASGLDAQIDYVKLPLIDPSVMSYIQQGAIPGGTKRNWNSYGANVIGLSEEQIAVVADPQTSGGLLICVDQAAQDEFEKLLLDKGEQIHCIGTMKQRNTLDESKVFFNQKIEAD